MNNGSLLRIIGFALVFILMFVMVTSCNNCMSSGGSGGSSGGSSSGSSSTKTCQSCGRTFSDSTNKNYIRHTNMCRNCYRNYCYGVGKTPTNYD